MYRLGIELAHHLIKNRRSEELPKLELNERRPFEPRNLHSIGFIDPICAIGTDLDYLLECPTPMVTVVGQQVNYAPSLDGYWLYRREELRKPVEPLEVPRALLDPTIDKNSEEVLDVTDCSVALPSDIDKLTCKTITTLDKLLELEPSLKACLKEVKP